MIHIDYKSRKPLYQQIYDQIGLLAARGVLAANSQLPSVRNLAVELAINPNTIQKAYSDLEKAGVIYSLPGRGSFIAEGQEELLALKRRQLQLGLHPLALEAIGLGLSRKDFLTCCNEAYQQQQNLSPGGVKHD